MIPESFIQELLARVDITEVVGRYVQLRKGGANLLGLCPFHNEKSPSFTVSPTKQFYHCFGCGAHGSAINFLMEHTGATFPEAVRNLAGEVGMVVPEAQRSPRQREADRQRKAAFNQQQQFLDQAQAFYEQGLRQYVPVQEYLKQRGISGQIAKQFGLGWSGQDRRGLSTVYANYQDPQLVEAGLVIEADDGRRYDRFRKRLMFPIRNHRGHLIGFGGRLIAAGEPKYLNSPETPLFSKGQELYGLWESRQGIRQEGFVLVVEGYMDVVALAQSGLTNAVATLGTATTADHLKKLMRASERIVFCFDADRAGRQAAWRALETCLPLLRDDVSMRFLFLDDGHDPDSYVRAFGADAFREQANQASALSTFMLDELAKRHPLVEAEGRAACVHEALPLLAEMADCTLALQIRREFAARVQLTPEELDIRLSTNVTRTSGPAGVWAEGASAHASASADWSDEPPMEDLGYESEWDGFIEPDSMAPARGHTASSTRSRQGAVVRSASTPARNVMPLAKRLLRLLAACPALVAQLSDQQLEIIVQSPNLILVQELIALIHVSEAQHAGALLEAVEPNSEMAELLQSLTTDLLGEEDLPANQAAMILDDILRKVELELVGEELETLVTSSVLDEAARRRIQELCKRRALLVTASKA